MIQYHSACSTLFGEIDYLCNMEKVAIQVKNGHKSYRSRLKVTHN